jgi:hypothetical protein
MNNYSIRKKILIVSGSFYPQITPRSFRSTELAKELSRQGHEVTICIPFRGHSYSDFSEQYGVTFIDLGPLKLPEIKIRVRRFLNTFSLIIRRILLALFEYPNIELMFKVNKALRDKSGFDLLISMAWPYPVHWGVAIARRKKNRIAKIWVADCGDPFMGDTIDSFRKLFYFKYVEKWFCQKTDYISIPRIEMKQNYYADFHEKIREIPQGFNFDEIIRFNAPVNNKVVTFAFAGSFIPITRDPSPLMNVLASYGDNFKFVVYSNNPEMLYPYVSELGSKLEIKSFVPRKDLIFELSKMDFLVNISFDPVYQSPSKLIDYALAGRPILNIAQKIDRKLVEAFLRGDYSCQFVVGNIQKYNIVNVARQFVELLDEKRYSIPLC